MKFRSSNFLGIAVADRTITCAELSARGDHPVVRHTATFELPAELSLEKPDALGQALATFLRSNGFSTSRAVIGVPARWVIATEKDVPPASQEQLHAILRLAAERSALAESGEIGVDYVGRHDSGKAGKVLLVAIQRKQLERIEQTMEAAGLSVAAITPTSLALAAAVQEPLRNSPMLMLAGQGAEIVWQNNGTPRMLRHVPMVMNGHGSPPVAPLAAEIRRSVALTPQSGEMVLWNAAGWSDAHVAELGTRLGGVKLRPGTVAAASAQFAPPVALALAGANRDLLPLDFSHSRLSARSRRKITRGKAWGIALGATALLAVVSLGLDVRHRAGTLTQMQQQLAEMQPDVKTAQAVVERVRYSSRYFDSRTPALECLREVTRSFHDNEQIWATSFAFRETGKGQLMGKAAEWKTVLDVADRLRQNPVFSDVKFLDVSESGGRSRERSFSISFIFTPAGTNK